MSKPRHTLHNIKSKTHGGKVHVTLKQWQLSYWHFKEPFFVDDRSKCSLITWYPVPYMDHKAWTDVKLHFACVTDNQIIQLSYMNTEFTCTLSYRHIKQICSTNKTHFIWDSLASTVSTMMIPSWVDPWPLVWESKHGSVVVLWGTRRARRTPRWLNFVFHSRRGFEDLARNRKPLLCRFFLPPSSTGPCSCPFSL